MSLLSADEDTPRYYSFKDFLSETEAASFFELTHAEQVVKVTHYLDFLGQQKSYALFKTSPKASISFAKLQSDCGTTRDIYSAVVSFALDAKLLKKLLEGRTRSGFGAFGTEDGFLSQKRLSLAVAASVEEIGHTYIIERNKHEDVRPPVLNSRSFFFYWCHAEKQKLIDIKEKLTARNLPANERRMYWEHITIVVDRAMCNDCISFAKCLAHFEMASISIEDPDVARIFPPAPNMAVIHLPK
ncbi:uncharacterized protein PHALS_13748 [Plasmopara halstedii]|uniref:Single-strand DNA deaminase toxin A-like C-terminal domain-containing protein n=1 Tax=Plasmopara halstedii TaxID=4781 RepID=A0A0P1APV3_PLAHL|nr:uncharacterized protein PHALS_13748 [Plasmopara halstedii]CEG43556.1 hypothetical protein PHALS_13748 [Plasmopara halstedii]|eukprot:XP_024579925.1 hypothetical protein PHALS_13748 [Plasmopara halstedii]